MLKNITHLLKYAILVNLFAIPIMLAFWWFMMDHSLSNLSNALIAGGVFVMALSVIFNSGPSSTAGNFQHQYIRTTSSMSSDERVQQDFDFHAKSFSDTIIFIAAGVLSMLVGCGIFLIVRLLA